MDPVDPYRNYGRVRLNESQAQAVYPVLYKAEKELLGQYLTAKQTGQPFDDLKRLGKLVEQVRRGVLSVIEEKGWTPPVYHPSEDDAEATATGS